MPNAMLSNGARGLAVLTVGLLGCGDLSKDFADAGTVPSGDRIAVQDTANGVVTFTVDATDEAAWVYGELATPAEVTVGDLATDQGWDVAFQRFNVKLNSGYSGAGENILVPIPAADFDALTVAPEEGWVVDQPKTGAPETPDYAVDGNTAFAFRVPNDASQNGWFEYDARYHLVAPADVTYALRAASGQFYKWQFLAYYDEAGSPGKLTIRYAPIEAPARIVMADPAAQENTVDASGEDWVHFSLSTGRPVSVETPEDTLDWDIAFRGPVIRTNSGPSGTGRAGMRWAPEGTVYNGLEETPTGQFLIDREVSGPDGPVSANPLGVAWHDGDPSAPRDEVILVRGASGDYAKLQLVGYEAGLYTLDVYPVAPVPEVQTATVGGAEWTYYDLEQGRTVAVGDPSAEDTWDLGVKGTLLRTNGGTSGPGEGGVRAIEAPLDALFDAPLAGYSADSILDDGAEDYSGSAPMADWYDGDPSTPRNMTFALKTRHGEYAKLQIDAYEAGVFTVRYVYAGPDRIRFD